MGFFVCFFSSYFFTLIYSTIFDNSSIQSAYYLLIHIKLLFSINTTLMLQQKCCMRHLCHTLDESCAMPKNNIYLYKII